VGVADEKGINRAQDPFREVVELTAVEQDATTGWPDIYEHDWIIDQAGEKAWLQIAKQT